MSSYMLRMLRREDRRLFTGRALHRRGVHPNVQTVNESLPCVVRPSGAATTEVAHGGEQLSLAVYDVRVPHDTDIRRGDTLTMTRSSDWLQVGQWVTVVEVVMDEWATSRIAVCHRARS